MVGRWVGDAEIEMKAVKRSTRDVGQRSAMPQAPNRRQQCEWVNIPQAR
jgi:hypothetical protein